MPCADATPTAPALNNNATAPVDNSFAFLTGSSSGCPQIPDFVETSLKNVLPDLPVPNLTDSQSSFRHCLPGSAKAPFVPFRRTHWRFSLHRLTRGRRNFA